MRREGSTLSSILRNGWDGGTLEILTRHRQSRATSPHISCLANITPEELSALTSGSVETVNGFVNRFLWCRVRSTKDRSDGGDIAVVDRFIEPLKIVIEKARLIQRMERSPEAEIYWGEVYSSLKYAICKATERGRPQVVRLSMLYALLDGSSTIHVHHLKAAIALWRYCEESAYGLFADAEGGKLATKLLQAIKDEPGILRSKLRQSIPMAKKTTTALFDNALSYLLNSRKIVKTTIRQATQYSPAPRGQGDVIDDRAAIIDNRGASDALSPFIPLSKIEKGGNDTLYPLLSPQTGHGSGTGMPEPVSPNIPLSPLSRTKNLSGDEFFEGAVNNPQPIPFRELVDWSNFNKVDFEKREGGIWITDETRLTPAIRSAIHHYQKKLVPFV